MLLRTAAAGCFMAAALVVAQPETDVQDLDRSATLHPEQRIRILHQALRIHPRNTAASLRLGLELERSGDLGLAEQVLVEAARFDHQYLPAWTLANFYFRRKNPGPFWLWSSRAAGLTADLRPLLRLANVWAPEPSVLVARLGDRPELLRPYLDLLIVDGRFEHAQLVAGLLGAHHDPADLPRFDALHARLPPNLRTIRSAANR